MHKATRPSSLGYFLWYEQKCGEADQAALFTTRHHIESILFVMIPPSLSPGVRQFGPVSSRGTEEDAYHVIEY